MTHSTRKAISTFPVARGNGIQRRLEAIKMIALLTDAAQEQFVIVFGGMALLTEGTVEAFPEMLVIFGAAFLIVGEAIYVEGFSADITAEEVFLVAEGAA